MSFSEHWTVESCMGILHLDLKAQQAFLKHLKCVWLVESWICGWSSWFGLVTANLPCSQHNYYTLFIACILGMPLLYFQQMQILYTNISQNIIVTHFRCDAILADEFISNLLLAVWKNIILKNSQYLVEYGQEYGIFLLTVGVVIF